MLSLIGNLNQNQINPGPGWVVQLVRGSSQYDKIVGLIPYKGTYKSQLMNT